MIKEGDSSLTLEFEKTIIGNYISRKLKQLQYEFSKQCSIGGAQDFPQV